MQVTELSAEGLKRQFKIVVPAGDLSAKVDERLAEMARTAQMPGFRPGKVPVGLLKKQYGQALYGEALEQAVNASTAKAIEDRGLKPALQPRVDLKELEEGKDVEFEVAIEVLPEIGKLDFSGIELERLKAVVPDKDVDEAIERIAKANREQKPVDPPRPAQKGDAIKLDFVGSVDGKEFPGGAAAGLHAGDRLGLVHSGLRGPADRRRGRQAGRRQGDVPGRLRRARTRRQGRRLQVHDQGDPRVRRQAGRRRAGQEEQLREPRGHAQGRGRAHRPGLRAGLALDDQAPAARQARRKPQVRGARRAGRGRVQRHLAAHRGGQEERPEARGRRREDAQGVPRDRRAPGSPWPAAGRCRPLQQRSTSRPRSSTRR